VLSIPTIIGIPIAMAFDHKDLANKVQTAMNQSIDDLKNKLKWKLKTTDTKPLMDQNSTMDQESATNPNSIIDKKIPTDKNGS
jgi:hypothetical protein